MKNKDKGGSHRQRFFDIAKGLEIAYNRRMKDQQGILKLVRGVAGTEVRLVVVIEDP